MTRTPLTAARKPIRPKRAATRRRDRDDLDHGLPWSEVRAMIHLRSLGRCEACGRGITLSELEGHHRRTRRVGPDCPCNALALCGECHQDTHAHPEDNLCPDVGRILSRHDDTPPSELAVVVAGQGRVFLTCGGTYIAA